MATGQAFANIQLAATFNQTTNAGLYSATGTTSTFYISLHTADPTSTGNQTTNEISSSLYINYARAAVSRTTAGFLVTNTTNNAQAALANAVAFPQAGSGTTTTTVTNFAIGTASTGTGMILYTGTLSPSVSVQTGSVPTLTSSTTVIET